jgi:SAM-dependent methyltransferase
VTQDRDAEAFFTLHAELPREGPGETADVAWAAEQAQTPADARVLDAACGPGGDIGALLRAAPQGHVTAIDKHAPFIAQAETRWGRNARVRLRVGDMTAPEGPFDLIWCAGAVYFLGIEHALPAWRTALAPGGVIAFSEPCHFTETPSPGAQAFWGSEATGVGTAATIAARVSNAGFEMLDTRRLSDVAWEGYFRPIEDRISRLRPGADPRLLATLDHETAEIERWRAHREETGYLLLVVRPS